MRGGVWEGVRGEVPGCWELWRRHKQNEILA